MTSFWVQNHTPVSVTPAPDVQAADNRDDSIDGVRPPLLDC